VSIHGVRTSLAFAASLLYLTGCESTTDPVFAGQPPLPGIESMFADLSLFLDSQGAGVGTHFTTASDRVAAGHAVTTTSMPLPVVLFAGAQGRQSVSQSDGYHWIYSVAEGAVIADVNLKARATGTRTAVWDMRVSSGSTTPALNSFVLLTGTTSLVETIGTWRLFDASSPTPPKPLLNITWSKEGNSTYRVTYVNIEEGSSALGDYLDFERTGEFRRVSYFDMSAGITSVIDWNFVTETGSITAPNYNNGARSCWNAAFINAPC
jgi:hypothetical protein